MLSHYAKGSKLMKSLLFIFFSLIINSHCPNINNLIVSNAPLRHLTHSNVVTDVSHLIEASKLIQQVSGDTIDRFVFRGERLYNRILTPTLFRGQGYHEHNLIQEFQLQYALHDKMPTNTFDWLSLMQHFGSPTRVLDWSNSILVAAYFATSTAAIEAEKARKAEPKSVAKKQAKQEVFACMYILDTHRLNQLAMVENEKYTPKGNGHMFYPNDYAVKLRTAFVGSTDFDSCNLSAKNKAFVQTHKEQILTPIVVSPRISLANRMHSQHSVFTLYGGILQDKNWKPKSLEKLNEQMPNEKKFLWKFPLGNRLVLQQQLKALGIHPGTVYMDLDNYSKYLESKWRIN